MTKTFFYTSFTIPPSACRRAFTLVELLVVIGIIAVLMSILFPVIGKIREAARETDSRAFIASLEGAAQSYKQDFNAYPGPLPTNYITARDQVNYTYIPSGWRGDSGIGERIVGPTGTVTYDAAGFNDAKVNSTGIVADGERVTGAENFLLGLLGGVSVNKTGSEYYLEFDASAVGKGPVSLNPVKPGVSTAYMQSASISKGKYSTGEMPDSVAANNSKDSRIPEFVDRWPEPMPILVLRARVGGKANTQTGATPALYTDGNNNVVVNIPFDVDNPLNGALNGQYNLVEATPYTQSNIGTGKRFGSTTFKHGLASATVASDINKNATSGYVYPFNAFPYFADPATYTFSAAADTGASSTKTKAMKARKQDVLILISAGRDRVYGTADDITNFGSVLP